MVEGIKTVVVKSGEQRAFEALFRQLRAEMRANEPGCLFYALFRSRSDPRAYVVQGQYRDDAALAAHRASPHRNAYLPKMQAVAEKITLEYFDMVDA